MCLPLASSVDWKPKMRDMNVYNLWKIYHDVVGFLTAVKVDPNDRDARNGFAVQIG
jgi:hypothetical protein